MPKVTDHPQVSVIQRKIGAPYQLVYKLKGEYCKRGTGTLNIETARHYARALSTILVENRFNNPPDGTPDEVLIMLGLEPKAKRIARATNESWFSVIERIIEGEGVERLVKNSKNVMRFIEAVQAMADDAKFCRERLAVVETELGATKTELKKALEKVDAYEIDIIKRGKAHARLVEPRTLRLAVDRYLDEKTRAKGRYKNGVRNMLDGFANAIGEDMKVLDVPEESVVKYLEGKMATVKRNGMLQIVTYVCAVLEHGSGGLYDLSAIQKFRGDKLGANVKDESGAEIVVEKEWYWLEPKQVEALIRKAGEDKDHGQYWADAMRIQHGLGLRPEELPLLQASEVHRTKKKVISHVYIKALDNDGTIIRNLKTPGSTASLGVNSQLLREALERRLSAGHKLLFPRNPAECGGREPRRVAKPKQTDAERDVAKFERENQVWQAVMWDEQYLAHLRKAAKHVRGVQVKKVDGRTLRRTRGRDIVLKTLSIDMAATFLRDAVETVRRHYAKLIPTDVSV